MSLRGTTIGRDVAISIRFTVNFNIRKTYWDCHVVALFILAMTANFKFIYHSPCGEHKKFQEINFCAKIEFIWQEKTKTKITKEMARDSFP